MKKLISILIVLSMILSMVPAVFAAESATITFDSTDKGTLSEDSTQQVWTENGITLTNDKASSSNNVLLKAPIRCYKGSDVTIEYPGMKGIVFECVSDYVLSLESSDGVTVTTEGTTVTVVFDAARDSYTISTLAKQARFSSITVYTGDIPTEEETTDPSEGEDTTAPTYEVVTAPVAGTAYKVGFFQKTNGTQLYITGEMSGYYLAMTEDVTASADVYLEEVEGGYHMYCLSGDVKSYIDVVLREGYTDKVNVVYATEPTCVYTYDETANTMFTTVGDYTWYLGTYGTYSTVSPSKTDYITGDNASKIDDTQFPIHFYTEVTENEGGEDGGEDVTPPSYSLIGYINGANYGCEDDWENIGEYIFVDGTLTATFTEDSYVFVKTTDNAKWYMTDGWLGTEVTEATLYNTATTTIDANKLYVPGGVEVTFTLVVNEDDTLTLSYTVKEPAPEYELVTAPVAGTAYKVGFFQKANGTQLYITGEMSGYYLAMTEDVTASADVYLEEVEGGYHMYCLSGDVKSYIDVVLREGYTDKVNVVYATEPTCVYTYDETANTMFTTVGDYTWYLGTYGTYSTVSPSKTDYITGDNASKIDETQFPIHFYAEVTENEGGDVEVPENVLVVGDNHLVLPNDNTDGLSYTFTATETGTIYMMVTGFGCDYGDGEYKDNSEYMYELSDYTFLLFNDQSMESGYYGSFDVVAGETYTLTWAHNFDAYWGTIYGWTIDLNVSYSDELIPKPGSADLPIELYSFDCPTTSVEIPAGSTVYYTLYRFSDTTLTVKGENAYIMIGEYDWATDETVWTRYDAVDGVASLAITSWTAVVQIGNSGEAAATFELDCYIPVGQHNNPYKITENGTYIADVQANSNGYYFTWIGEEEGVLTVTVNGEDWIFAINNISQNIYGDAHSSTDDPVAPTDTIAVFAGDEIIIQVNTNTDTSNWTSPAAQIEVTVSFEPYEFPVGSQYKPYFVSANEYAEEADKAPKDILVPANSEVYVKLDSFFSYQATFTGDGIYVVYDGVTYTDEDGDGIVCVEISYLDTVIVGNSTDADITTTVACKIPLGQQGNPEEITDGEFSVDFEASWGYLDPYYFTFTADCDVDLTLTFSGESWGCIIGNQYGEIFVDGEWSALGGWIGSADQGASYTVTLELMAGDVITVQLASAKYDPSDFWAEYPAGTVTMTAETEYFHVDDDGDGKCDICGAEVIVDTTVYGDINGDGEIDLLDANLAVGYYNETADLTEEQLAAADVNCDGEIDLLDANLIVGYYNETVESLPQA